EAVQRHVAGGLGRGREFLLLRLGDPCYMRVLVPIRNHRNGAGELVARRRSRTRKAEPPAMSKGEPPKTPKQSGKAVRSFDSSDLFRADTLTRIRHLQKQIAQRETTKS